MPDRVATVAIGRNEGDRLVRCLSSLKRQNIPIIVYVDSGSTDGSIDIAKAAGAELVELDLSHPFTAARARNAGFERVREIDHGIEFIQFVDGDCELFEGWIVTACATLRAEPDFAAVYGRQRERFPEATLWNRLMDMEWDTPIGEAVACGGNALFRRAALDEVGGFRAELIAGEEPEICFRLRQKNWRIRRIKADMALHDAAMTRFGQWWNRSRRAGYSYAALADLHGSSPERFRVLEVRRALIWGLGIPFAAVVGTFITPWSLLLLVLWPLQVIRLWLLRGEPFFSALFLTISKVAESLGVLEYKKDHFIGRTRELIEYK